MEENLLDTRFRGYDGMVQFILTPSDHLALDALETEDVLLLLSIEDLLDIIDLRLDVRRNSL